jgi:hypothetical protein
MNVRRTSIAILVAVVAGIGAGAAHTGSPEPWRKALQVRSEALNAKYGLGTAAQTEPGWLRALSVRSEALNAKYGLGEYATP